MSALAAAYDRGFEAEFALNNGEHVGDVLLGFAKFFDHIDGNIIYQAGVALGFPRIDLHLGLSMRYAARWLVALCCFSDMLTIMRSILPGFTLAIPFTRVYLKQEMADIIDLYWS